MIKQMMSVGMGPIITGVLIKRENLEQNLGRRQCEEIGRKWPSTSQEERPVNPTFMLILDL